MSHFVGGYWGMREELRIDCATRIERFLSGLAAVDTSLALWYKRRRSRKSAFVALPASADEIAELLVVSRRDDDRSVIKDLGYGISGFNDDFKFCKLAFDCNIGSWSQFVENYVVLTFYLDVPPPLEIVRGVFELIVRVFDPDVCVFNSTRALSLHPELSVRDAPAIISYTKLEGANYSEEALEDGSSGGRKL